MNGAGTGTAGYGNDTWAVGQSYADHPQLQSWYYNPAAPKGSKWSKAGLTTIPRMYHSSATLLPDGTVMVSGSNPNSDCEYFELCRRVRALMFGKMSLNKITLKLHMLRNIKLRSSIQTSESLICPAT